MTTGRIGRATALLVAVAATLVVVFALGVSAAGASSTSPPARPAANPVGTPTPSPLLTLDLSGLLGVLTGSHASTQPPSPAPTSHPRSAAPAPATHTRSRTHPVVPTRTAPATTPAVGSVPSVASAVPVVEHRTVPPAHRTAPRSGATTPASRTPSEVAQDYPVSAASFSQDPLVFVALIAVFSVAVALIVRAGGHRSTRRR